MNLNQMQRQKLKFDLKCYTNNNFLSLIGHIVFLFLLNELYTWKEKLDPHNNIIIVYIYYNVKCQFNLLDSYKH